MTDIQQPITILELINSSNSSNVSIPSQYKYTESPVFKLNDCIITPEVNPKVIPKVNTESTSEVNPEVISKVNPESASTITPEVNPKLPIINPLKLSIITSSSTFALKEPVHERDLKTILEKYIQEHGKDKDNRIYNTVSNSGIVEFQLEPQPLLVKKRKTPKIPKRKTKTIFPGAFGSCTQFPVKSRFTPKIYKIKVFRTGAINCPGVRWAEEYGLSSRDLRIKVIDTYPDAADIIKDDYEASDAIDCLLYLRDFLSLVLGYKINIPYFFISMRDYTFSINLEPHTKLNIRKVVTYLNTLKWKEGDDENQLIKLRHEAKYSTDKPDRCSGEFYTPTAVDHQTYYRGEKQQFTKMSFFRRDPTGKLAKIDINGASHRYKAEQLFEYFSKVFIDNYDLFMRGEITVS
jgi:hypothetical protein